MALESAFLVYYSDTFSINTIVLLRPIESMKICDYYVLYWTNLSHKPKSL